MKILYLIFCVAGLVAVPASAPLPPIVVKVDKPFMYYLLRSEFVKKNRWQKEVVAATPLFFGVIHEPKN